MVGATHQTARSYDSVRSPWFRNSGKWKGIYGLIIIKVPAWLHYWAFILPGLVKFDIPAEELFSGIFLAVFSSPC